MVKNCWWKLGVCYEASWLVWACVPDFGSGGQSCEVPKLRFQERSPRELLSQHILCLCRIPFSPSKILKLFMRECICTALFLPCTLDCHYMCCNFTLHFDRTFLCNDSLSILGTLGKLITLFSDFTCHKYNFKAMIWNGFTLEISNILYKSLHQTALKSFWKCYILSKNTSALKTNWLTISLLKT